MKKKCKNIFLDQQLREICTNDYDANKPLIDEIQKHLLERTGQNVKFGIWCPDDKTIQLNYELRPDKKNGRMMSDITSIDTQYTRLVTGEGFNGYLQSNPIAGIPRILSAINATVHIPKTQFYDNLRENTKKLGGDRIKNITAYVDEFFGLILEFQF